jgi:hypothetical protein
MPRLACKVNDKLGRLALQDVPRRWTLSFGEAAEGVREDS